jgi:hypothetical protein
MSYNRSIPCENPLDPMNGVPLPEGREAELVFIDGQPVWTTNPPIPPEDLPVLLVNQNQGGILIDEGIYLAI